MSASPPAFLKRKPASRPGVPRGFTPWHVFAFFLRVEKEGASRHKRGKTLFSISAQKRGISEKDDGCAVILISTFLEGLKRR